VEKYAEEVMKTHSLGSDWQNELIDANVMYASGGGKAYGW
jgi:hypothetical protein